MNDEFSLKFKLSIKNYEMEKARLNFGLKQSELAELTGLSGATISQIEICYVYPSIENQKKISKVLKISTDKLFPEWLQVFSKQWKRAEKTKVVNSSELRLGDIKSVPFLESPYDEEKILNDSTLSLVRDVLKDILNDLPKKERQIIEMKNGLLDGINHDLGEIGKEFGVTRERIRQIEAEIHEKIRHSKKFKKLQSLYNDL